MLQIIMCIMKYKIQFQHANHKGDSLVVKTRNVVWKGSLLMKTPYKKVSPVTYPVKRAHQQANYFKCYLMKIVEKEKPYDIFSK